MKKTPKKAKAVGRPLKQTTIYSRDQHLSKTGRLHLDKRAPQIIAIGAANADANDDDLLTTYQVAAWFGVSTQWLENGRSTGNYGPPFEMLGPGLVRYKRGRLREWLSQREYTHTAEYRRYQQPTK